MIPCHYFDYSYERIRMPGEKLSKDYPAIDAIIKKYDEKKEFLICILQDLQARYGYLPKEALMRVAEKLNNSER